MNFHAVKALIIDKLTKELSPELTYHGLHHTLDVLYVTEDLCKYENIPPYETMLLKTAALFHDAGFTINNKEHERLSCELAQKILPQYGYLPIDIDQICSMIMATKIPQSPKNKLEAVICDADLDYLGRDDFYYIGSTLFQEFKTYKVVDNVEDWNRLQVNFLEKHSFFTSTNLKRRSSKKQQYIQELKSQFQE